MSKSTITAKGQTTVPADVRTLVHAKPGTRLATAYELHRSRDHLSWGIVAGSDICDAAMQQKGAAMNLEQLMGRYSRLQQELSTAYSTRPWQSDQIDRLTNEIASTEREIAALQASARPPGKLGESRS
jgi:bifunctional DNA-binding transcriptional regulator/antitoxin component of YhaV-PrlF toxin-antitoxin module